MNKPFTFVTITKENISTLYDKSIAYDAVVGLTHPGVFHADDVMCAGLICVMLHEWCPDIKFRFLRVDVPDSTDISPSVYAVIMADLLRVGVEEGSIAILPFDVGCGDFDHHQGREDRPDGVPYAAFGKLWDSVGEKLVGDGPAREFETQFVYPIDLADNGIETNPLSTIISQRNPFWDEFGNDAGRFNRFIAAVADVSSVVILRFVQQVRSREREQRKL